jgi:DUF1680 family protein
VPNLIYATQTPLSGDRGAIYVNLFIANKAKIEFGSRIIDIEQKTDYPWNGKVEIAVNPDKQTEFTVKIRIPSWVRNEIAEDGLYHYSNEKGSKAYSVKINGKALGTAKAKPSQDGYVEITRSWKKGDKITLDFSMETRTVEANPLVTDDAGKYAVERGPIVYCSEKPLEVNASDKINYPDFLKPAQVLTFNGQTLIPYYSWSNRGASEMAVWMGN